MIEMLGKRLLINDVRVKHHQLFSIKSSLSGWQANVTRYANSTPRVLMLVENVDILYDRRVWQLAQCLNRNKFDVTVICPKSSRAQYYHEKVSGVNIFRYPQFEASRAVYYLVEYLSALIFMSILSVAQLRHGRFELIYLANPPDILALVAIPHRWIFKTKILYDQHDPVPEMYEVKGGKVSLISKALKSAERLTVKRASGVIFSNFELLKRAAPLLSSRKLRSVVVRSSPSPTSSWFTCRASKLQSQHISSEIVLGYVGIIGFQDHVDVLVDVMEQIIFHAGRKNIKCVVVGDGEGRSSLERKIAKADLNDYFNCAGFCAGVELEAHINKFDIGIIPDRPNAYNDLISLNKTLEYMALGIPIVHFDLPETNRMTFGLGSKPCSDIGEMVAAVLKYADSESLRLAYGYRAQRRLKRVFPWHLQEERFLRVVHSLVCPELRTGGRAVVDAE